MRTGLNPNLEAQLEAILEAHHHPAEARPLVNVPTTTSMEARIIRHASEPWQREIEALRRHEARRAWLMAGFAVCTVIVAIWITGGR